MRIIFDTGALYRPKLIAGVGGGRAILPSIVLLERLRQLRRDGRDTEELEVIIRSLGLVVESLTEEHARRIRGLPDDVWRRMARDAMIACHVGPDDVLWTTDPKDFLELGLRPDQVVALR